MPGLDANALVRWILDDDPRQAARVYRLFEEVREQQTPLFVPSTDCLHAGQRGLAGRAPMITFNESASRLPNVWLLKV